MAFEKTYFHSRCNSASIHNKYPHDKPRIHMLPPLIPRQLDKVGDDMFPLLQMFSMRHQGVESLARGPQLERTRA